MGTEPEGITTTVVIPSYNYARYLAEAIDSALAQSAPGVEVLVVDDGSTDGTAEVLARYVGRIRVHRQPNTGVCAARNAGAQQAQGRYLAFLDADNRLRPTFVEACVAALEADPAAGFAYPQLAYFGDSVGVSSVPAYDVDLLLDGNAIDMCALVRRELVLAHGFDAGNRSYVEDWDLWLTLAEQGWTGVLVDEPLVEYRWHGDNASLTRSRWTVRRGRLRVAWRHRSLLGTRRLAAAWWAVLRLPADLVRDALTGGGRDGPSQGAGSVT